MHGREAAADSLPMRPLAPAAFELRWAGGSVTAAAAALAYAGTAWDEPRGLAVGLAAAVLLLWVLTGAATVRRAIRLALPVRPRWTLESTAATVGRVLLMQTLPLTAIATAAGIAAGDRVEGAGAAAAGALAGAGFSLLLAAGRVRRAERALGSRLLRRPRPGHLLDRRSLYVEPATLAERPAGSTSSPWSVHRPPSRSPRAAIELEPANGSARHAVGVGLRTLRPSGRGQSGRGGSAPAD